MNTPSISETDLLPVNSLLSIAAAHARRESIKPTNIRSLGQKERTKAIRSFLRAAGVQGVSVKMATGSMCYWTNVYFEKAKHGAADLVGIHDRPGCDVCQANIRADNQLEALILTAFPDLDNRSDSQSDYFDFVFTVDGR